jgi:hypothetical protein
MQGGKEREFSLITQNDNLCFESPYTFNNLIFKTMASKGTTVIYWIYAHIP